MKLKHSRVPPNLKNIIKLIEFCYYCSTNDYFVFNVVLLDDVKKGVLLYLNIFDRLKDLIIEGYSQKFHLRFYNNNNSFKNFLTECLKDNFSNGYHNMIGNSFIEFEISTDPHNGRICSSISVNFKVRTNITLENPIIKTFNLI